MQTHGALSSQWVWRDITMRSLKTSRPVYGNCIQQTMYALLRGFGHKLVLLKSRSIVWPIHLCVELAHKERYYSFETTKEDERYAPWWFIGQWRPINTHKANQRMIAVIPAPWSIIITAMFILILYCPWTICWALYQPSFMVWWAIRALIERFQ